MSSRAREPASQVVVERRSLRWARSHAERAVGLLERREAGALRRHRALALEVALELDLGRAVLLRPLDVGVADARGLEQRPGRVREVRAGDRAQVGAAGGDDAVD